MTALSKIFSQQFPHLSFLENFPLAKISYVGIGGEAELFFKASQEQDLIDLVSFCQKNQLPYYILGGATNTLINDQKISCLVIKNAVQNYHLHQEFFTHKPGVITNEKTIARWQANDQEGQMKYQFADLDFQEEGPYQKITFSAGMNLANAISLSLAQGLTGLQWFAGIPGTLGGAIYSNIHGGTHFFNEYLLGALVIYQGKLKYLKNQDLQLGYDDSILKKTQVVVSQIDLALSTKHQELARRVKTDWIKRKKIQPHNSLGCIFQNLSPQDIVKYNFPTSSIGFLIDKKLKLAAHQIGQAQISAKHAAFIENLGGASAKDYFQLIKLIYDQVQATYNLQLAPEISFLGFSEKELHSIGLHNYEKKQ